MKIKQLTIECADGSDLHLTSTTNEVTGERTCRVVAPGAYSATLSHTSDFNGLAWAEIGLMVYGTAKRVARPDCSSSEVAELAALLCSMTAAPRKARR